MTGISVPQMADVKDVVTLTCTYSMGQTKLNSVKWYKEGSEFFRWVTIRGILLLLLPLGFITRQPLVLSVIDFHNIHLTSLSLSLSLTYTQVLADDVPVSHDVSGGWRALESEPVVHLQQEHLQCHAGRTEAQIYRFLSVRNLWGRTRVPCCARDGQHDRSRYVNIQKSNRAPHWWRTDVTKVVARVTCRRVGGLHINQCRPFDLKFDG